MAVRVVHKLEVVEVDDGNAGVHVLVAQTVLIEATVVDAGEGVAIEKFAPALLVLGSLEGLGVEDDAGLALDLDVAGRGHVARVAHAQHLCDLGLVCEDLLAHDAHARAVRAAQQAEVLLLDGVFVEKAHHGIELAVPVELGLGLGQGEAHKALLAGDFASLFVALFGRKVLGNPDLEAGVIGCEARLVTRGAISHCPPPVRMQRSIQALPYGIVTMLIS